ncbi:MAG: hypothetical protein JW990_18830 [Thermoleophilia bacterium]|nr:hypothetical protein [Thermoleophilia bacterium]
MDRRSRLLSLVRRRQRRDLRYLFANLTLIVIFFISMVTGFAAMGSG